MLRKIVTSPYIIFPVFACLLFWPITFQLFTVKNDALSYYYPVRTLISDAINNGELPLWTPFINLGYPLHADLQSGAWNPIIWIFSLLTNYSLAAFHAELLLYISFAGIGFYYLCKQLGASVTAAFLFGLAYQGCGFIVDSVQFFNCISAACYLPFIFLYFFKSLNTFRIRDGLLMAIFMWLMFTGGYPSIFIISIYCLLATWIYFVIRSNNKVMFLKKSAYVFCVGAVGFLGLSLPAIWSFYQHLDFIERGGSQSLATVLENSMNPTTTLSLLSPFSTTAPDSFLSSSILMRSIYMGVIPSTFFVWGIFNRSARNTRHFKFFVVMGLTLLGFAFGEYFILRSIGYYILPLMDSFRHPGLFRLFFIFFILLAAMYSFETWLSQRIAVSFSWGKFFRYFLMFISTTLILMVFLHGKNLYNQFSSSGSLTNKFYELSFAVRFTLQTSFLLVVLWLAYFVIVKKKHHNWFIPFLMAELFLATSFNLPVTVIGSTSFADMNSKLHRNAINFPLPTTEPIESTIAPYSKPNYISNPLQFEKLIGRNDIFITPGNLKSQDSFYYSSERIIAFQKPVLYVKADSGKGYSTEYLQILQLGANQLTLKSNFPVTKELVYQQNYYPGWKCFINGIEQPISKIYRTEMAVTIPAGVQEIKFSYEPRWIRNFFYISMLSLIAFLVTIIFYSFVRRRSTIRPMADASV